MAVQVQFIKQVSYYICIYAGDGQEEALMSSRKTGIALGLAGVMALSASTPSMAFTPTAVAAITKAAPSTAIIDVRWGWWPGIGIGIGLGLLGAAIAAPYYGYGYPYYSGYPYGYASYGYPYAYGYGYPYGGYYARPYWGWRHYGWRHYGWHRGYYR